MEVAVVDGAAAEKKKTPFCWGAVCCANEKDEEENGFVVGGVVDVADVGDKLSV